MPTVLKEVVSNASEICRVFFLNPGLQRDFTEMLMKVQCFLMNVYWNAMAELQKKKRKTNIKKQIFFFKVAVSL